MILDSEILYYKFDIKVTVDFVKLNIEYFKFGPKIVNLKNKDIYYSINTAVS